MNEKFISLSSNDGQVEHRVSCSGGRQALAGGAMAQSVDNGGTLADVQRSV